MITVIGAKGAIPDVEVFLQKLHTFCTQEDVVIQALDAAVIYGKQHLISATQHAKRAFEQQTNSTNTLALEILLYAAGERQIQKAIKKMGVKKGKGTIAFVIVGETKKKTKGKSFEVIIDKLLSLFHLTGDDKVLEGTNDTLKRFGITDQEKRTVPEGHYGDLILEKISLVDVIK